MLDVNKITKGLEDKCQPLEDVLGECGVELFGDVKQNNEHFSLSFNEPCNVELFIRILVREDEKDTSSFSNRVLGEDYGNGCNWKHDSLIINDLIDRDDDDEIFIMSLTSIVFPIEDYDEVIERLSKYRDQLVADGVGFCKGCFVVQLEDLIKFNQFEIIDLETGVTSSGSGIESVSLKEGIVQVSLAK